jgi:hypothetical protein
MEMGLEIRVATHRMWVPSASAEIRWEWRGDEMSRKTSLNLKRTITTYGRITFTSHHGEQASTETSCRYWYFSSKTFLQPLPPMKLSCDTKLPGKYYQSHC